jgi:hypothetical protein
MKKFKNLGANVKENLVLNNKNQLFEYLLDFSPSKKEEFLLLFNDPKITRVKSKYSHYTWINNHICRSDGEYILANFLLKNNIKYEYEKAYDNKMRCDFYLNDYNLYVEYFGMKSSSYINKLNYLNENNINHVSSNNVDELKEKIINYVNNNNK